MLKNVIENYLTSIREVEFFGPFKSLLEGLGYYDIHLIHSPVEFGKDFIAKKDTQEGTIQYCFQIKIGDINLNKFTNEIKPQLLEIVTNSLSHPNFDKSIPLEIIFVTTGNLKPPATIAFQEFNNYLNETLKTKSILTWEKDQIISDFYKIGIEPFFELHNSPEFVGRFFNLFSQIKNCEQLSSFDITFYTDHWLNLDLNIKENKLQVWFEGYFFSKLLFENKNYYESVIFLAALCRVLIKNDLFDDNSEILLNSIKENINNFYIDFSKSIATNKETTLFSNGFFSIFTYPLTCLKSLELLSLYSLLFDDIEQEKIDLIDLLLKEKGSYRSISDNYAISIFFISQFLLKNNRIDELKTYLNNCVVWICDRYEQNGISPIGYKPGEEYEQLMSEYLDGLNFHQRKTSFVAAIILDISAYLNDPEFYASIANDFRAVEIIPEYYHIDNLETLFDYNKVITQTDYDFKLELKDDFTDYIKYRNEKFSISLSEEELYLLAILLRDRYFPQVFLNKEI
jgi:hypothetical protein